ncbi:hypothetical protein [Vibrio parahaemolyticus]|uniref:hypothetical protein n=1 Tax=Vibrio parahaemolyticus TaxID=670 RepID=UPI00177ADB5E|nr:hypothetical protein [Vibrio parahaemolyticus]EKO3653479.1 hypothetical protein [Vibrio metschnikovii]EJE8676124.1 hypothetical protein [Vibrio parahaemolyticus]EJV0279317.1 hypothetical protein [Vibrio parahaemolyticus]MBD6948429.1 hypothetical protein [Vibrio parahaemolyticus]MBD6979636.1 hypothetical protein [Vibrio parahaemolyticus]
MNSKLEQLKQQQAQLAERIKRETQKQKERERKDDTRRKILIGAMILDGMKNSAEYEQKILKNLDQYLTQEKDRKLFKL